MERRLEMTGGGYLSIMEDGGLVRMDARREDDGRGLYKVWLRGEKKGRMLLGTLSPEQGGLRVCRRLTRQSLMLSGCWPIAAVECVLAFSFCPDGADWVRKEGTACPVTDELVRRGLRGRWVLTRKGEEGVFFLACPFDNREPFPLPALFCLARIERVEGRSYAVFSFDGKGRPCLNEKEQSAVVLGSPV